MLKIIRVIPTDRELLHLLEGNKQNELVLIGGAARVPHHWECEKAHTRGVKIIQFINTPETRNNLRLWLTKTERMDDVMLKSI